MIVSGNQITLLRRAKALATVPCKWKPVNQKEEMTAVVFDKNELGEIRFSGMREVLQVRWQAARRAVSTAHVPPQAFISPWYAGLR